MKYIPYSQMIIGLDQLMFGGKIVNEQQAIVRSDAIENFLAENGWNWDMIIDQISMEESKLYD